MICVNRGQSIIMVSCQWSVVSESASRERERLEFVMDEGEQFASLPPCRVRVAPARRPPMETLECPVAALKSQPPTVGHITTDACRLGGLQFSIAARRTSGSGRY